MGGDKHVMKSGGGGLIVNVKLNNCNRDTSLMPINTHLTDVELMMTCISSDSSDMIPPVDCGMVDFLDRDRRSNLVLPSRFGQGNNPPLPAEYFPEYAPQ